MVVRRGREGGGREGVRMGRREEEGREGRREAGGREEGGREGGGGREEEGGREVSAHPGSLGMCGGQSGPTESGRSKR